MTIGTYEVFRMARLPTTGLLPPNVRSSRQLAPHYEAPRFQSACTLGPNWVDHLDLSARQILAGLYAERTAFETRSLSRALRGYSRVTKLGRAGEGSSNP